MLDQKLVKTDVQFKEIA